MTRPSAAARTLPGFALFVLAAAALAVAAIALRPDPREVVLRSAAAAFVVGIGVAAILAVLIPIGWTVFVWRRTAGRRSRGGIGRFLVVMALTIAAIGVAAYLVWTFLPASPISPPAPEA